MQAVWVALIAVMGTLAGSVATGVMQRFHAERALVRDREHQRQQRQLDVVCSFVESIAELRRRQIWRWSTRRDRGRDSDEYRESKDACFQARTVSRACLLRLQLAGLPDGLVQQGKAVFDVSITIEEADDVDELNRTAEVAREALEAFVGEAGRFCSHF